MTKRLGLLVAWLTATLVLGVLSYGAVALVGSQVTDQPTTRVIDLSAVTTSLAASPETSPSQGSTSTNADDVDRLALAPDLASDPAGAFEPSVPTDVTTTTSQAQDSVTTDAPGSTTPTNTTTTTSTTTTTTSPPNSDDPGDQPIGQTGPFSFTSEGGVVTVMCRNDEIAFGGASPASGAQVAIRDRGPEQVVVEFARPSSEWRTVAMCIDGTASAEFE